MKKNVPSDHLEEFLNNTFETYTESPSEEVWERIAAETKAPPKVPFKVLRSYPFWIGTAVALLAGFIIYQLIYFNQELEHINRSIEEQQVDIQELRKENQPDNNKKLPQAAIENINTRSESRGDTFTDVNKQTANFEKQTGNQVSPIFNAPQQKHDIVLNKTNHSADSYVEKQINTNTRVAPQSTETIYLNPSIPAVGAPSSETVLPAAAKEAVVNDFAVTHLASKENQLLFTKNQEIITIPPALELPVQRAQAKTGLYVGANAFAMKTWSKIKINDPHPIPPRNRREFNQPDVNQGNTLAFGVNIGNKIADHVSLESGLLYQTSTSSTTHQPRFKFNERKSPPHGGPRDYQFEYDLNTPTGTVALAITVENTASSTPDEEEIALEITTKQSLTYLSIPLLLNYQIGNGKLHFNAKGGVLTNFLLNNDFTITDVNSNNINFRPQPNQPFQSEPLYFNQLSLDFLLQLGVAYDVTPNLSVNVSPTFISSISNQSANRFVQSSSYSAGLSAGVTWSF